tara:strand:+ start:238 stop:612 length:375 start_codon:yes stop_codon:yes gene_type:complete
MAFLFPLLIAAFATVEFRCVDPMVHDGDNIRCAGKTMRLAAIDAPEVKGSPRCRTAAQRRKAVCDFAAGERSKQALRALVVSGSVRCRSVAPPDRFGRPIVRCRIGNVDLGAQQIARGLAKAWP